MTTPATFLPRIGWGKYDPKGDGSGFEGPLFFGSLRYEVPAAPTFLDKVLATITATEGGAWDAYNAYDRCALTTGLIQWGERCAPGSVTAMLRACADRDPDELREILRFGGIAFARTAEGWTFAPKVDVAALAGGTGRIGQWETHAKLAARRVAASFVALWHVPAFREAQCEYTRPRLLEFATRFGHSAASLFATGYQTEGWEGALRAGYLSFAANLPAVAARRAHHGMGSGPARDRCITLLRELTFGPGVAIYPGRYEKIQPVLERLFGVDLPDFAGELRTWRAKVGSTADLADVVSIQRVLHSLGYDLGPAGADGKMGPKTRDAVRAFQRDKGLIVDGMVGPHTLAALARSRDTEPPPTDPEPTQPGTPTAKSSQRLARVDAPIVDDDDLQGIP